MAPFRVEYYCPSQSPYWQGPENDVWIPNLRAAIGLAQVLRPPFPLGRARVVDSRGIVVYQV